jgi:hypothetical protein
MPSCDWRDAIVEIPADVPRVHHGRDPAHGLDCIGLVMAVCRRAGVPFDDLDLPYGQRDHARPHRFREVAKRLDSRFRRAPVDGCWQDGDILMIGDLREGHLAIVVGRTVYQMTTHLRKTAEDLLLEPVVAAWRAGDGAIV